VLANQVHSVNNGQRTHVAKCNWGKFKHRSTPVSKNKKNKNIEVLKYCKVWPFILRVWTMGYGNEFDHKFKMATVRNECQYILSSIDMNISNHKMKLTAR
jgi:hypothetical protein